ncbi:MAG: hypothetical protein AAB250_01785 [Bdellovibrionota bacterium]
MRPSDAFTLPLTTLATLLTVVACGPTKDYVPVNLVPGTPLGQAFAKCTEEIRPSKAKVVTTSVSICEEGKDGLYAKVAHTFRYDVQSSSGQLRLSIKPALEYTGDVTKQTHSAVKTVLGDICMKRIDSIFQRSLKRGGVSVDVAFNVNVDDKPSSDSPVMELSELDGPETTFVIKTWAHRARLYPYGLKKDMETCAKQPTDPEKARCRWAAVEAANEQFCVQLAVLTGHWVGLKTPKGADQHCKEPAAVASAAAAPSKPAPPAEADSIYMKGAYEMEPKEFFAKAALSRSDLKAVFAPACTSFRNLPEEAALRR